MQDADLLARLSAAPPVLVVGDVMLDHYVEGAVERVSDEAPVPILRVRSERWALGGAANVAANIAALGGRVTLVGVVGADADGERVRRLLAELPGVDARLVAATGRPTTLKTRYVGASQQMIRVDREDARPLPAELTQTLAAAVAGAGAAGALVVSDYGKGVVAEAVLATAFARPEPAIVDPKRHDLSAYRGAAVITPNRRELTVATALPCESDPEAEAAAAAAMAASGAAILLTRSEKGMSLFRPDQPPVHRPTEAREVFDVSGAGDTVVAVYALATAAGLDAETAMRLANAAAGVVVAKVGAAVALPAELLAALSPAHGAAATGAISLAEAVRLRERWAGEGLRVGFANGCFDLIHPGHVSLLRQAAAACDRLIVALNTDRSVRALKGEGRPLQSETARAEVMAAIRGVDAVILFDEPTPLETIAALQPDLLVKGADYTEAEVVGADLVKARGGRILLADLTPGQSTTAMAERMI